MISYDGLYEQLRNKGITKTDLMMTTGDQEQGYLDAFDAVAAYEGICNIPEEATQRLCKKTDKEKEFIS